MLVNQIKPFNMPKNGGSFLSPEIESQTTRLFSLYKQGNHSVRELARINDIPFSTLRDRFRSRYGIDYTNYRAGEGTLNQVIQESINSLPRNSAEYKAAKEWFEGNRQSLLALAKVSQDNKDTRLYTNSRINRDIYANCRLQHDIAASPFIGSSKYAPYIEENGERIYLHN